MHYCFSEYYILVNIFTLLYCNQAASRPCWNKYNLSACFGVDFLVLLKCLFIADVVSFIDLICFHKIGWDLIIFSLAIKRTGFGK